MAKSKQQFLRFKIIDGLLKGGKKISSVTMRDKVVKDLGEKVTTRTIQNDINDMKNSQALGFFAPLEYDTSQKKHFYSDYSYTISKIRLKENEIAALKFYANRVKLYSDYSLFGDLSNALDKLVIGVDAKHMVGSETDSTLFIQTDTENHSPGSEHLSVILQGITNGSYVTFNYQKFGEERITNRTLAPVLLKEYKNRWYVLGYEEGSNSIKTFGLDRISALEVSKRKSEGKPYFDVSSYFSHSFGITKPEEPAQKVTLKFLQSEIPYIKSLPIHPTQVIIEETKDHIIVEITVIPSFELYEFLLGKSAQMIILSPQGVIKEIAKKLLSAQENIKVFEK